MNNLFPPHRDVHTTFDLKVRNFLFREINLTLKGSIIGRMYNEEEAKRKPGAVLKDLNWIDRHMDLQLGPQKRGYFVEQVTRDVEVSEMSSLRLDADMVVDAATVGNNGL